MKLARFQAGYSRELEVVSGINVVFPEGSVTAVLGPNGSGKSTLLKGIMGFSGVSCSGSVMFRNTDIRRISRKKRAELVGYLPQSSPVPAGLTGLETVLLGRHPHRSSWAGDSQKDIKVAEEALELVDASYLAEKPVDRISGGERRLVNLAAVLAQETPVILLDEPGSSLDYGNAGHLWQLLSRLAKTGKTIIATTHRIGMAAGHFDRVLLIAGGTQIEYGEPEKVFSSEGLLSQVYGTPLRAVKNGSEGWIVVPEVTE
ncbi:cobalamin/Fe(3+)-siderophore ABC transporter ATP-binding protein [Candidatus Fermentibacteria bacterium]|nr:MAG: cobalamin/Fe(3+)-siderophore ABC transporter ATP-binding protein [Candidatus Fermentibacteria bacterium]